MSNILCIDVGTRTGWAATTEGVLESGVQDFSLQRGESTGMKFVLFNSWLTKIFKLTKPRIVVYEMAHQRGGYATEILVGMITRIQERCAITGIDYTKVHSASLKKWATGNGRASKGEMMAQASRLYGVQITDDNEADALLMLSWAKEKFG